MSRRWPPTTSQRPPDCGAHAEPRDIQPGRADLGRLVLRATGQRRSSIAIRDTQFVGGDRFVGKPTGCTTQVPVSASATPGICRPADSRPSAPAARTRWRRVAHWPDRQLPRGLQPLRLHRHPFFNHSLHCAGALCHLRSCGPRRCHEVTITHAGQLRIHRDWGWAPEYVQAMWLMLQRPEPRDFVIATGRTVSLGISLSRPSRTSASTGASTCESTKGCADGHRLQCADPSLAERELGWKAIRDVDNVIRELCNSATSRTVE